jgi:WD40 repeat protein
MFAVVATVLCMLTSVPAAEAKVPIGFARSRPPAATTASATAPAASPHLLNLTKVKLASFSPDGQTLMTVAEDDRQVHFWRTQTGEEINRFSDAVTGAIFSGSGNRVMTWGDDNVVRIFDARTGKALRRLQDMNDPLRAAALSPDGSRALTCAASQCTITLWDAQSGRAIGTLEGHSSPVTALAFSPDGTHALSLSGESAPTGFRPMPATRPAATGPAADISLRCWDLQTRKSARKIDLPSPGLSIAFSTDGELVLVAMRNASKIFDLVTGKEIPAPRTPQENFPAAELTADRKTGLWKAIGSASITNAATGDNLRPLERPIEGLPICHAFSADGARVILGTGKLNFFSRNPNEPGSVYVYEVATGKRLATFTGHAREVTHVAFATDGNHALSRDSDKTLFLWAVPK